jgi:hypothetical protein
MSQPNLTGFRLAKKAELACAVPLEEAGSGEEVANRVREGKALLEIVSTPWGVEFYVRDLVRCR